MQSLQASNLPAASLLLHSSRVLASGTAASARIRKLESDLAVLRNSLEAYKQYIYSQLASHEKDLQTCLAACESQLYVEAKDLDKERSLYTTEIAALEGDLSGLYVQMKGCVLRVQTLERVTLDRKEGVGCRTVG